MENRTKTQQEIEQEILELNEQFATFLHTKGIKAKYKLVVENIKKCIKDAPANTAKQIANAQGKTQQTVKAVNASTLEDEFNSFLKSKGLDNKYIVTVTEN